MNRFSALLDALVYTPSRNGKLRHLVEYFSTTPDPDRGWALAAIAGTLDLPTAKPALVREVVAGRTDPTLFALSYDYVGDLAETSALIWPAAGGGQAPHLHEVVTTLQNAPRTAVPDLLERWLDTLDASGRWALLKLITGGLRVGISARLAKTALAAGFGKTLDEIEHLWHGLAPPYEDLFAWLEGRTERPEVADGVTFHPFMLAQPLGDDEVVDLDAYAVEWKWDGIRVQASARGNERRLYSRSGDDISGAFPDVLEALAIDAVLDGELLVRASGDGVAPFNDLQQRLNRKAVTRRHLTDFPAFLRVYDILFDAGEDLRGLPFTERRARLESFYEGAPKERLDLSDLLPVHRWDALAGLRIEARERGMEGLMLKRKDSLYVPGRPKGAWYKWKRDPLRADVVLLYAQRGHGKRSSFYSDYTFGAWRDGELVPVGKAYFGFTDEELARLDRWVRNHTVNRFGPVREVEKSLVLEVAFDSVHRSTRHKSGLAMRFPRIKRIRLDKPAGEADHVETLAALIQS